MEGLLLQPARQFHNESHLFLKIFRLLFNTYPEQKAGFFFLFDEKDIDYLRHKFHAYLSEGLFEKLLLGEIHR